MRRWMAVSAILALAAGGAWAQEKTAAPAPVKAEKATAKAEQPKTGERLVWGKVTAVDAEAGALVMEAVIGKGTLTVGVAVEKETEITAAPGNSLKDIKAGDTVRLRYLRTEDRLIAKAIEVQPAGAKAPRAKKAAAKAEKK